VAIAVPPAVPVLPVHGPLYLVVLALIISLVLSIVITYAVDYFDPSFHSPDQVREALGIPVVVSIDTRTA
jgi:capsular polysaccharide biosynthesis protein